jgi:hypothetical protein
MTDPVGSPASGPIYSFVPADGASPASAVAGQLSRVLSKEFGQSVLLAEFDAPAHSEWHGEAPRRLDGRTWGAFLFESNGHDVLDAREVNPRQLESVLDYAREHYALVCADLSGAREAHAVEVLRQSDAVFVVGATDAASIEMVRDKADWLRSLDLEDRCGLLLWRTPQGASALEAEDLTGLPVCGIVTEGGVQVEQFAAWLASHRESVSRSLVAV